MSGLVVAGMHRSGTSLATRLLAAAGWDPGERLLTNGNEQYFEDESFVELHRNWIAECRPSIHGEPTLDDHPDWGVVYGSVVDPSRSSVEAASRRRESASQFIDRRRSRGSQWVAKDPRCTLFLDDWATIADLRFLLVYRNPWDVIESAVRLGHEAFCRRPSIVRTAWLDYNRRVLDFTRRHRDRVVLVAGENLVTSATAVEALSPFVGRSEARLEGLADPRRFTTRTEDRAIASVYRDLYPDHVALLHDLDELADRPRPTPTQARPIRRALPGGTLDADVGVQVVTPCRNDGDFLAEAVASVDEIADGSIELTIVDDGSTDPETLRVLDRLRRSGRHVITTSGLGLPAARNRGFATSTTRAVIPLDADNRLRTSMSEAVNLLVTEDLDVVHGAWQCFGMDDRLMIPPDMVIDSLMPYNTIDACAVVSRRLLTRLDGWDEDLPFWEDWDLWLGAVGVGARTLRVDQVLFDYLIRPESLRVRGPREVTTRAEVCRYVLDKHERTIGIEKKKRATGVHQADRFFAEGSPSDRNFFERAVRGWVRSALRGPLGRVLGSLLAWLRRRLPRERRDDQRSRSA